MKNAKFFNFLAAVRQGDPEAATKLVRRYEPFLRRVIRMRLAGHPLRRVLDSIDICQSILGSFFARAAAGQFELHSAEDLRRLLVTMALNKLISKARRELQGLEDLPEDADLLAPGPTPDELAAERDLVEECLRQFTPQELWLFEQNKMLGRPWAEIAPEIGSQPAALRMQLTRAIVRIRKQFPYAEASHAQR